MFKYENNNEKIGAYLKKLIEKQYPSHRQFCKAYLIANGTEVNDEELRKLSNRLSQIIKGKKAIQTYDLPYFTDLLGVSCEEILSCGKSFVPISGHITNYEVAFSKDPKVWENYYKRPDKLIFNPDEYNKTIIDYAIEFKNYALIKFLIDKGDIWFVDDSKCDCSDRVFGFAVGTNIKRRETCSMDVPLNNELVYHYEERSIRQSVIALAMENKDFNILYSLRAREIPTLYQLCFNTTHLSTHCCDYYNEDVIDEIAHSNDAVLAYFSDEFQIQDPWKKEHTFVYPFLSKVIEKLVASKSKYAEPVIRKAIEHNKRVFDDLSVIINDYAKCIRDSYNDQNMCSLDDLKRHVMDHYIFFKEDDLVSFWFATLQQKHGKYYSNVVNANISSNDLLIGSLIKELNKSYNAVQNIESIIFAEKERK